MTISFKELQGNHLISDIPINVQQNMDELLKRINMVRDVWGKPMTVTSGYRTEQDMLRIYRGKGIADDKIPMHSAHMVGMAVDISDPDLALNHWLKNDPTGITTMEKAGLYGELGTTNWTHLQWRVPGSGHRWFQP